MAARQISAKYSGKCAHCGGAISPGDPCMYEVECKAIWHIECHADRMSTERSPIQPVQEGTTARFKKPSPAVQEIAEHIADTEDDREKLIGCLKRVRGALGDALELRNNLAPRALYNDITATWKDVLGDGSWME